MLNICNFAQEIISRPTQTWLSPPDSSLQLWGNKFSPTPRRGRSPLTPYPPPPHPLVQPAQAPLRDPVHRVQKWVIAFFTPGSAQDAAQLRFGKTCSQWESKKPRMLPPPELLHVCEEGAKLEPNCIKLDYAFPFHFETQAARKTGEKMGDCTLRCGLRFTSCDGGSLPLSGSVYKQDEAHSLACQPNFRLFQNRASPRLHSNNLKPGFHLITLSHNFANCPFTGELSAKT